MQLRLAAAAVLLALAGCGGDDPGPRAAPAATAPGAAELSCSDHVTYSLSDVAAGTDAEETVRTLFEDELQQYDAVEPVDGATVRVVRGGRVVAVAHLGGGYVESVDACESFAR